LGPQYRRNSRCALTALSRPLNLDKSSSSGQHWEHNRNQMRAYCWLRRNDKSVASRVTSLNEPARCLRALLFLRGPLFLLLALMVFAWGTGYKLSLYKAPPKDGTAPAKLCTRSSDKAWSAIFDATQGSEPTALLSLPTLLFAAALTYRTLGPRDIEDGQPMHPSPFHPPSALDLRPPPRKSLELA